MIATARLERFAVVTFDADPVALAALLPDGVEIDLPVVSAVAYRYHDLRLQGVPGPRITGGQVHLRAYVRVGDERGVWFLRTVQDSRWATLPRRLWGMPWERGAVSIQAQDGGVQVNAGGIDVHLGTALGTALAGDLPAEVTGATVGWFQGRRGVMRFEVAFADGEITPCCAKSARVEPFEALGVVVPGQQTHSAFRHADTDIQIHLPPTPAFAET